MLGLRLLSRSTHGMKLTEDGERCFERAKEMLASWGAFEADLRGVGDEPEGMLRVVVPNAFFGQQLLVGPLAEYLKRYPRVSVDWLLRDRQADFMADGVDCAVQIGDVSDLGLIALKLSDVPRVVVGAPSLLAGKPPPAHPSELASLPWLALRTFYRSEIQLTHGTSGEASRVPIRPRMNTDNLYALRSAAVLGVGVCVGSTWLFEDDLAQGTLVQLVPEWHATSLPVHLVYPHARFYPARLRRFIDTVRVMWDGNLDAAATRG
jgi:DNA-binding transcriptional LysR family regulator